MTFVGKVAQQSSRDGEEGSRSILWRVQRDVPLKLLGQRPRMLLQLRRSVTARSCQCLAGRPARGRQVGSPTALMPPIRYCDSPSTPRRRFSSSRAGSLVSNGHVRRAALTRFCE